MVGGWDSNAKIVMVGGEQVVQRKESQEIRKRVSWRRDQKIRKDRKKRVSCLYNKVRVPVFSLSEPLLIKHRIRLVILSNKLTFWPLFGYFLFFSQ